MPSRMTPRSRPGWGPVELAPDRFVHAINLDGHEVSLAQAGAHVLAPQQRGVGDHGDGNAELAQRLDAFAQTAVQGRLAVRDEAEIVGALAVGLNLPPVGGDARANLFQREEGPGFDTHLRRRADLTVAAGVAAHLGWDVVDAQTPTEPARGDGTEGDTVLERIHTCISW